MFRLICRIPDKIAVAVSGGVDSMACLDFLSRSKRDITVLHFNHGTPNANKYQRLVESYCEKKNLKIMIGHIGEEQPNAGQSIEEFWRTKRHAWFESTGFETIITCHNLNDVVEWWLLTSFRANPKLMPAKRGRFLKPFILNEKRKFISWCERHNIDWIEDITNEDIDRDRNYIRHVIIPHAKRINPGIEKSIRKKLLKAVKNEESKSPAVLASHSR